MNTEEQQLDLESTFRTLREFVLRLLALLVRSLQYWPILVLSGMVGIVAGYFAPKYLQPIYNTQAVLMYRDTVQTGMLMGDARALEDWPRKSAAIRDALTSRSKLSSIVVDLGLYPKTVKSRGMLEAVEEFRRNLDLDIGESQMISISFRAHDPDTPVKVVTRMIEELKKQPNVNDAEQAASTRKFLDSQLESITKDLFEKESALAIFLNRHPEFAEAEGMAPPPKVVEMRGSGSGDQLAALRRQRERIQQQLAEPGPRPVAPQVRPEDKARVDAALAELSSAQAELKDKRARFTEKHPDVLVAQKRVGDAQAKLNAARRSAALVSGAPAPNDAESRGALERQLAVIDQAIARAASRPATAKPEPVPEATAPNSEEGMLETRWASLRRDVDTARAQYHQLQQRLFAATTLERLQDSGGTGRIEIIDPPLKPPKPSARGPRRTAAMALAGVVGLGMMIAFFLTLIDDRLYDAYDLRSLKLGPIAHMTPPARPPKGKA